MFSSRVKECRHGGSTKHQLLASKTGVLVPRLLHRAGIRMGAHLGESGGCPFTEQTDRKVACIIAKASASTDRSFRISQLPLGAGSAP